MNLSSKDTHSQRPSKNSKWGDAPRLVIGLSAMTIIGTAAIVVPYLTSGYISLAASFVIAILLFVVAWLTWKQIKSSRFDNLQEILLREAFHSMLTPQLITDGGGNAILANRAFRGWIDVGNLNAEEALSSRFQASPAVANEFKHIKIVLQKGQPGIAELPVVRGGKVVEWRRIVARPIDGYSNFYHWRFEDISERRRMEKAMRDEQNKLVDFMAHAPVGIYSVDQHGRFRFVNQTLAEWLQVAPEELVKGDVHLHDIINDATRNIPAHAIVSGTQGELRGEVVMRRRNGQLFPVAISQTVVTSEDGKTLRTRSVVRDLSPEREWQQALSVSEYRFQRLFAEAPIGILLLDNQSIVMECNHAFHSIIRSPRSSIVSSEMAELIAPRDRAQTMTRLAEVLNGVDLVKPLEVRMAGDREIICQVFVKRFGLVGKDESDQQQGLMLYFIDSTEQKHLEMQFAQSQKMQAIGQLAGGVAHDFNNLLTAMIGFCDLLLQRHKPGDQSFNDIMQIKQNGNRAANLVRQLLAFSRQQTLQPKVLNLVDVLAELTNLLRRLIGAQIKLEMIHGRDVGLVKVDQGQLEQVIINLVVNSRDAMPQGGVVTIRTRSMKQDKSILHGQDEMPPGEYVVIEVTDTGHGIPKEIITRIFEPFFSTKEVGSGTGLGLSTVYGIVRQTGGFVDVTSDVGRGSTFTIYLPKLQESEHNVKAQPEPDDQRDDRPGPDLTGVGTVLLVEDEDAVRVFSARALRNKGYNVLEARSGEEALALLEKQGGDSIDLTVTDVVMPQMDGPTLYKFIRERWPTMKVIFVSGYTEDRLREQFKSGETIYFLSKPFTLKQLAGKVKDVLGEQTVN